MEKFLYSLQYSDTKLYSKLIPIIVLCMLHLYHVPAIDPYTVLSRRTFSPFRFTYRHSKFNSPSFLSVDRYVDSVNSVKTLLTKRDF